MSTDTAHAATLTITASNGDKIVAHGSKLDMATLERIVKAKAAAVASGKIDAKHRSDEMQTVDEAWEFWRPIICNDDGSINVEQLKLELCDAVNFMGFAACVYDYATGGRCTKVNTLPSVVKSLTHDHITALCDEAVADASPQPAQGLCKREQAVLNRALMASVKIASAPQPEAQPQPPIGVLSIKIDGPRTCIDVEWHDGMASLPAGEYELSAAPSAQPGMQSSSHQQFKDIGGYEEPNPIERLRIFCSIAMRGPDWIDVEQFFNAIAAPSAQAEPPKVTACEGASDCVLMPEGICGERDCLRASGEAQAPSAPASPSRSVDESEWHKLVAEVEAEKAQAEQPICGNCDEPAPGCGGLFADDGEVCKFHGKAEQKGGAA